MLTFGIEKARYARSYPTGWRWPGVPPANVAAPAPPPFRPLVAGLVAALAIQSGWLWAGNVPAPERPEVYRRIVVRRELNERPNATWLWRGNVPANVVTVSPDLFGAQFSQGTETSIRLSTRRSVVHAGVPPVAAAVSVPPVTPLILTRAAVYRDRHWLHSGNLPAPERPELYLRIILGRELNERPNPTWLWRGNIPFPEQPELYRQLVVRDQFQYREIVRQSWLHSGVALGVSVSSDVFGAQFSQGTASAVNAVIRRSVVSAGPPPAAAVSAPAFTGLVVRQSFEYRDHRFLHAGNVPNPEQPELYRAIVVPPQRPRIIQPALWRGNVPTDVFGPLPKHDRVVVSQQIAERRNERWLWAGNLPAAEQPELYRVAVSADNQQHRGSYQSGFRWPGNVPTAEQPEVYRTVIVPDQFQHRDNIKPAVLRAGNQPLPEQPELYYQLVVGQRRPHDIQSPWLQRGVPSVIVLAAPKHDEVLIRQTISVRPNESWLWRGNVPSDVISVSSDLFGAQFSQGTETAIRLSTRRSVVHAGVHPVAAAVSVPPFTPLIVSRAAVYRDRHWLHSGNLPAPERPELYRRITVGRELNERPNPTWLWRGNVPANVVSVSSDVFGAQFSRGIQSSIHAVTRRSVLHSGVPPVSIPPGGLTLGRGIESSLRAQRRHNSFLWPGNLPAVQQPELYRDIVVVQRIPERPNPSRLWPGNPAIAEQPELYRSAIIRPPTIPDINRSWFRHFVPQDVFGPAPKYDAAITRQQRDERPNVSRLLPGNQPVPEQPELYRLIVVGQQQPDTGRAWTFSGLVSPPAPKFDGIVLRQQFPDRRNESRLLAGTIPTAEQSELYRAAIVAQQAISDVNRNWFRHFIPPDVGIAPKFDSGIVRQQFDRRSNDTWLRSGNLPTSEQPELYRVAIITPPAIPDINRSWFRYFVPQDVFGPAPKYDAVLTRQQLDERPNASRLWAGNPPAPEQPELCRLIISGQQQPDIGRAWTFSGFISAPPKVDVVFTRQQIGERPNESRLWRGNVPAAEQPELYRSAIVRESDERQRDGYKRSFLWSGNVPNPEQPELYRVLLVPDQYQYRNAFKPAFVWPGNPPRAEQPEVYRVVVTPPQFKERIGGNWLWPGNAPLAEQPEVYRLITVREWQPDKGRAYLQWAIPSARFKFLKVSIEVRARLDGDGDMNGRITMSDHGVRPGTRGTGKIDHQ